MKLRIPLVNEDVEAPLFINGLFKTSSDLVTFRSLYHLGAQTRSALS